MKKRTKIVIVSAVAFVLVCCLLLGFAVYKVYKFYNPETQNVFEQLYYEVRAVRYGGDSVLVTGTEEAYADYDLGSFENIQIPELDISLSICFYECEALYIMFFNSDIDRDDPDYFVMYRYDVADNKLYGEKDIDYLCGKFLSHYFGWCGENEYSEEDLGEFEFELCENVSYH